MKLSKQILTLVYVLDEIVAHLSELFYIYNHM